MARSQRSMRPSVPEWLDQGGLHQVQDWMNLDRAALGGRVLRRPPLRVFPVLALEDEVAVQPWRLRVHRTVGGLGLAAVGRDAESGCRLLARVAVQEHARRLDLL